MMLALSGCADFHLPRIDPSGEHLFICDSPPPPAAVTCPPGTAPSPVVPAPVAAAAISPPPVAAAAITPPVSGPPRITPYSDVATTLAPFRTIQPVGSQAVLVAGVKGGDGYLRTNRRLEWSLAPGSVGQFTGIGQGSFGDFFVGDFTPPRIVTAAFAVGGTSRVSQRAGGPQSRVSIVPGQGWITVSSPVEGVSHVTVVAPDVVLPPERVKSATVFWIDAQFGLPTPAIAPAGTKQSLTTTVLRQSNRAPRSGWFVRYELACGPQAVFGPAGTPSVEAATNDLGQAGVEIFQKDASPGTSQVRVQVFKPADACSEKLLVRETSVLVTWTAPSLGIRQMGPPTASVGDTITYRIEVSNPGDLPARELLASEEVPDGLTFVQSNPAAVVEGPRLQWRLGDLAPRQQQIIEATFRTSRQGIVAHCVDVTAAGGLRSRHCANTNVLGPLPGPVTTPGPATTPSPAIISAPATIPPLGPNLAPAAKALLDLKVTPGSQAIAGTNLTFAVELTNRGAAPATGIVIRDTYRDGLQHEQRSPLERTVPTLLPGQTAKFGVMFRVTRSGPICHHVEATAADGTHVATDSCVTAFPPAGGPGSGIVTPQPGSTVVSPPPSTPPPFLPPALPLLEIHVSGPAASTVGKSVIFTAEITNRGQQPIANVVVSQQSDAALVVTKATEGAVQNGVNWTWSIPSLPPGPAVRRQVECECKQPGKACCRFAVAAGNSPSLTDQTCLEIAGATPPVGPVSPPALPPGRLSVTVDNRNIVRAGKDQTFLVQIANQGDSAENDIVVTARIPLGTTVNAISTSGPTPDIKHQVDQGTIRFSPVAELPPKGLIEYRIVVTTSQPGQITLQAEATSRRQTHSVGTKTVEVLPAE